MAEFPGGVTSSGGGSTVIVVVVLLETAVIIVLPSAHFLAVASVFRLLDSIVSIVGIMLMVLLDG